MRIINLYETVVDQRRLFYQKQIPNILNKWNILLIFSVELNSDGKDDVTATHYGPITEGVDERGRVKSWWRIRWRGWHRPDGDGERDVPRQATSDVEYHGIAALATSRPTANRMLGEFPEGHQMWAE